MCCCPTMQHPGLGRGHLLLLRPVRYMGPRVHEPSKVPSAPCSEWGKEHKQLKQLGPVTNGWGGTPQPAETTATAHAMQTSISQTQGTRPGGKEMRLSCGTRGHFHSVPASFPALHLLCVCTCVAGVRTRALLDLGECSTTTELCLNPPPTFFFFFILHTENQTQPGRPHC